MVCRELYTGPPIPDLFEEDVNWDETMLRQGYDFRTYVIYLDDNDSNLQPPLLKPHLTDSNQWPSLLEVAKQNHSPPVSDFF